MYVLVIFVPSERRIEVGRLGILGFQSGYYAYTGSAIGRGALSLGGRISRHLRKEKKKRWHIDFLLANEDVKVVSALIAPTNEKVECKINKYLQREVRAKIAIPNFGSSDCRDGCGSHLLYLGSDERVADEITDSFRKKFNKANILQF